jgi:hypothetical protein
MIEIDAMFLLVNEMSRARPIFATLFWIGLIGLVLTVADVFFLSERDGCQLILNREQLNATEQEAEIDYSLYQ